MVTSEIMAKRLNSEQLVTGRTATSRRDRVSAPTQWLLKMGYISGRVLHHGSGKALSDSVAMFEATHWVVDFDPNFSPNWDALEDRYNTIVSNYVLNVLIPEERVRVIDEIAGCLTDDGIALISVRSVGDSHLKGIPDHDGFRTSIGTFQKPFTVALLTEELSKSFKYVGLLRGGDDSGFIIALATNKETEDASKRS